MPQVGGLATLKFRNRFLPGHARVLYFSMFAAWLHMKLMHDGSHLFFVDICREMPTLDTLYIEAFMQTLSLRHDFIDMPSPTFYAAASALFRRFMIIFA